MTTDSPSPPQQAPEMTHEMKHLAVVECPIVFPGENEFGMSSVDMLPRLGIAAGLESRHIRVLDERIIAVCIFKSTFCAKLFFDAEWTTRADTLWDDRYQIRFEAIDTASAA
ncbi:MAG: hypothetical protein WAP03_14450 [Methylorubrum rhodinum]|jgi:hypothetical protein|uniref:hypothetical protein n=1 Tax=Methylorubrum rhodinum TaxID=29428 RepID=UPI003BB1311F